MAQHIPIQNFKQKAMRKIEQSIRNQGYFRTSMKFEPLPPEYEETPEDQVYITTRAVPKSICWFKPTFEVHTKPIYGTSRKEVTKIYLVA